MSAPDLLNPANLDASFIVPLGVLVLLLAAAWFLVIGYSMKFALAIVGAGRFGYWKSILIVLLAAGASSIISTTLMMISPGDPLMALLALVAAVLVYCLVVSMIAQCSFGKGFLTYLLNGAFNFVGAIPVVILLFVGILAVRQIADPDGSKMKQWKSEMAEMEAVGPGTSPGDLEATAVSNATYGKTAVGGPGSRQAQSARGGSQGLPQRLPSVVDESSSSSGGWFGWGAKGADDKPYPQFDSGSECRSGCAKNRTVAPKPPAPAATPSAPQANPFAN